MWVAAVKESAESITAQLSQAFADPSMSPALWRLLAIQFQQDIFVLDSQSWTISCYSCQTGPVAINCKTDIDKIQTKCLLKHWTHPGFHYGIGCLPLFEGMKSRSAHVFLITCTGKLVSTSACQPDHSANTAAASVELIDFPFAAFAMTGVLCLALALAQITQYMLSAASVAT